MVSHSPIPYRQAPSATPYASSSQSTPPASQICPMPCGMGFVGHNKLTASDTNAHRESKITLITADLLIPGDGQPTEDAALVIRDKLIVYVGDKKDVPKKYLRGKFAEHHVPVLMPGLWDAHIHMVRWLLRQLPNARGSFRVCQMQHSCYNNCLSYIISEN